MLYEHSPRRVKNEAVQQWRAAFENGFETVLQEYVSGDASEHAESPDSDMQQ